MHLLTGCAYTCTYTSTCDVLQDIHKSRKTSMLNAHATERELRATKEKVSLITTEMEQKMASLIQTKRSLENELRAVTAETEQKLASLGQTKRSLEDELRALEEKVSMITETEQELTSSHKAKRSLNGEFVDLESKKQETQNQVH